MEQGPVARWRQWREGVDTGDRSAARRSRRVLLVAAVTGAVTGLAVAGFERLTSDGLLDLVLDAPLAVQAAVPAVGLAIAALLLHAGGSLSSATADEYIRAFHDTQGRLDLRAVPYRLGAAVATLGTGGPLGYEGPSLYAGSAVGAAIQRRFPRLFTGEDSKVLLVSGAAAGVAAIFKAPVTGLVFALEVPYQSDLARRMLLPAATSAAAGYVCFAAIVGTEPILPVTGHADLTLADLAGAALIGVVAGLLARAFIRLIALAKVLARRGHPAVRVCIAGAVIAGTVLLGSMLSDESLVLGPGYNALRWALDPDRTVLAIVALGTLRVVGTGAVVGGGGVGGLFIPLVVQGALVGRAIGGVFGIEGSTLFPVLGMAAFLGAGYRVPLAAVVFVAEFTGRSSFVVPGLIAAVVAQLVMGRASISPYQVAGRVGHLEQRLRLPLSAVVDTAASTVPPDATIEELFWQHLVGGRQQSAVVVDGDRYLGIIGVDDIAGLEHDRWRSHLVSDVMRSDVPTADPDWLLQDAVAAMEAADVDRLAVCVDDSRFVGVISATDLVQLDELIDRTGGDR